MKNIFYKVGFIVLIMAAVIGITGGIAVAASPPDSTILGAIQSTVNNILAKLTSADYGLAKIDEDVAAVASNVTRMKTYAFNVYPAPVDQLQELKFYEDSTRHVSISFSGKNYGAGDYLKISAYYGFEDLEVVNLAGEAANGPHRIEFDTIFYKITIFDANPGGTATGFMITEIYGEDTQAPVPHD